MAKGEGTKARRKTGQAQPRRSRSPRRLGTEDEGSRRIGSLLRWPRGLVAGAIAAALTALIVGITQELFPLQEAGDMLRFGDPIRATVLPSPALGAVPGAASEQRLDTSRWRPKIDGRALGTVPQDLPIIPAHSTTVIFELQGERSSGIDIVGTQVRILKRKAPPSGTLLLGPGPQGASEGVVLQAVLDAPGPRLTDASTGKPYFPGHHVSLTRGEMFPLTVTALAEHSMVTWDLAIQYVVAARSGTEYVGAGGVVHGDTDPDPFAITALLPHMTDYHAVYAVEPQSLGLHYRLLAPDQYCPAERALWQHSFLGC